MRFEDETYVVLEVPAHIRERVKVIREKYNSPLASLPVEITVIGSSGVGTFHREQDVNTAFEKIDEIASNFAPITTSFRRVARFPHTGIFYFEVVDPRPFIELQTELVSTSLRFNESPFPFTPHCTIVKFDKPSERLVDEILSIPAPKLEFVLDTLSIYSLAGYEFSLLQQVKLSGKRLGNCEYPQGRIA